MKKFPSRNLEPLAVPVDANKCWSIDFMHDALVSEQKIRTFNVLDDFNRECLAIEIDTSSPTMRVLRVLERLVVWRGLLEKLRMDNGLELVSVTMVDWSESKGGGVYSARKNHTEFIH